jgi:trans-2,3-dihydro-3-hydroxyanthranilate isomerase
MHTLPYEIVDVFTDRPFTGNPLAVVFDAEDLASEQMQALANEFHLSETVFVLPSGAPGAAYRARIFTPEVELPFAGHPSVGAAVTVARRTGRPDGTFIQECGAGLLPIRVYDAAKATLPGGTPTIGAELDPVPLLAAVSLKPEDYAGPAPRVAGCGLEFPYVSVAAEAVAKALPDPHAARVAGVSEVCLLHWDTEAVHARVRVFVGVTEDPATGSAALGLGVWLVASGLLPGDGESAYSIRQGVEMRRPSTLDCTVTAGGGRAVAGTVTGHAVPIASGTIAVPPFVG